MRRPQTMPVLIMLVVYVVVSFDSRGTVQFTTAALAIGVFGFVDLSTNRGRAVAAEAFWAGLFAVNIGHGAHSTLNFILDLTWLFGGTALIAWLLRRAETANTRGAQMPSRS